jgi:hypothetical protein
VGGRRRRPGCGQGVELYQWDDDTTAHAVLFADDPEQLDGRGHAHRHPRDRRVAAIGDEVAVARALNGLAARLLGAASDDLSNVTGHPVQLRA